jgi:two-component system CheB/CheR fusion protein
MRQVQAAKNPVPALAAYARREDEVLALAAEFQRHLAKPVDPELLTLTVAELARAE